MRIISGINKGRKINAPKKLPVRPTTDQAKEALFNIISNNYFFSELSVLDLFTGSGNISYEFSSRGTKKITCVDSNKNCIKFVQKISNDLSLNLNIIKSDVYTFLKRDNTHYDIIFADPPYDYEDYPKLIQTVLDRGLLKENGTLIIEHDKRHDFSDINHFEEHRGYGNVNYSFFSFQE